MIALIGLVWKVLVCSLFGESRRPDSNRGPLHYESSRHTPRARRRRAKRPAHAARCQSTDADADRRKPTLAGTHWVPGSLLIALAMLTLAAPAAAHDVTWETAPVLELPELASWQTAAVEHWRNAPGVPTLEDACGQMPTTRRAPDTGGREGAWGRTRGAFTIRVDLTRAIDDPAAYEVRELPCMIWFEEDRLAELARLPVQQRGRLGCDDYVHELGHALGLGHLFRGDPGSAMSDNGRTPECAQAFPATVERCLPRWASATRAVRRQYQAGHVREARRAYRRWRAAHPQRARTLRTRCG